MIVLDASCFNFRPELIIADIDVLLRKVELQLYSFKFDK